MALQREEFGSKLGFILAAAGSAVGIGNMVGFPVAATKNGGGAFLLIYAIFVFFVCLPVMMAEMSLGRNAKKDPLGAYSKVSNGHPGWRFAGFLSLITPFMIAVFYLVITVWIFGYLVDSVTGNLATLAAEGTFGAFITSNSIFYYLIAVFLIVNLILVGGVQKGIEKAAKIMMPALFVMLVGMVIFVLTLDDSMAGVRYYLIPDFSLIDANTVNKALSQAFFSLSLGMGILITYGSYLSKKDDIASSSKYVALADTAVAFTAGLMILPAVFSFNPNTNTAELSDSSISLIFTFLPKIFLALQGSIGFVGASIVASVFFLLVFFAAITSLVSIVEVPVAAIIDEKGYSRKKSLVVLTMILSVFTVLCALSFGMVDSLTSFINYGGGSRSFFDLIYDVFNDTILPLNGLLICLFVLFRWKKANLNKELEEGSTTYKGSLFERYVNFSLSTFIPVILAAIFINTVLLKFFAIDLISFL